MSGVASAIFGPIADAKDILYDPFFGNNGETIAAAPDGRLYTSISTGSPLLVRNSGRASCPSAANSAYVIDTSPQFNKDIHVTMIGSVGANSSGVSNQRIYARYTSISACYIFDWISDTGFVQIGYRDTAGPHALVSTSVPPVMANTVTQMDFVIKGTTLQAGFGGSTNLLVVTDTRFASGLTGFQFFNTGQYLESYECVRS